MKHSVVETAIRTRGHEYCTLSHSGFKAFAQCFARPRSNYKDSMTKTLVIGARGSIGRELVPQLAAKGHDVIEATHRQPTSDRQVQLDLVQKTNLSATLSTVQRLFLLAPSGHTNQDELLLPVIESAREFRLEKVVLMTAMGANANDASPLRRADILLEQAGVPFNVMRPNWFMQNFNSLWIRGIVERGQIVLPAGKGKGSFIDTRDIAAVAAELLSSDASNNCAFDLTGPRALDHDEVAEILSRETRRSIRFNDISPGVMLAAWEAAHVQRDYAESLIKMFGDFEAGLAERTTDAVEVITGTAPRSFEQYARDYCLAWSPSAVASLA
jgi:uncharacterized protein YbjT (DUF2867 family)